MEEYVGKQLLGYSPKGTHKFPAKIAYHVYVYICIYSSIKNQINIFCVYTYIYSKEAIWLATKLSRHAKCLPSFPVPYHLRRIHEAPRGPTGTRA